MNASVSGYGNNGLCYKAAGSANLQGRPKIYFCCAAGDFETYFDSIAAELLEVQRNAVIWYRDPAAGKIDEEQFLADLGGMQLFVVPVTSAFLYSEDRARTIELAYAMKNHIPVLPLMQEAGLDRDFNKICGDLQFLDRGASETDPTALSYDEKLKKFLGSVLVGDELAKRIRNAFDAYIFLSYRKKDRAAAQSVMRLIHQSDFARDIAIWYDEFLTPGENFNDEIEAAMRKSLLFALVVTPNILENPNYVQTTEYPAAVEMGMDILPVEAEDTDAEELARMYDGLSVCAPAADPARVAKRLHELLINIALRQNDSDPVHNYLIGLAYLSGIDVEVDHGRALELITGAANSGLGEAYEKLVAMYRNGDGVGRDYGEAIEWQIRYTDDLQKKVDNGDDLGVLEKLAEELFELGGYQREAGDVKAARLSYMKCVQNAWNAEKQGGVYSHGILFNAYFSLGALSIAEKELSEAEEWYNKCLAASMFTYGASMSKRDMAIAYNGLSDVSLARGDLEKAKERAEKSLNICLAESAADPYGYGEADRKNLMVYYMRLGEICQTGGDLQGARDWYLKCADTFRMLAEETGDPGAARDMAVCYNRIGRVFNLLGDADEARKWLSKGLEASKPAAEKADTIEAKRDLALNYNRLGDIALQSGNTAEARKMFEKSLELSESAAAGSTSVLDRQVLSFIYLRMGALCNSERNYEEAEDWYRQSLDITEEVYDATHTPESCRDLSIGYLTLGNLLRKQGSWSEAIDCIDSCIEIGEEAEDRSLDILKILAVAYSERGMYALGSYDSAGAADSFMKSVETRELIAEKAKSESSMKDLADSLEEVGGIANISRKKRRSAVTRLTEVYGELYDMTGKTEYRDLLARAQELLATLQPTRTL